MLNKVFIMGRLCAVPELRRTQSGAAVVSVNVAVDRDFKSQDGSRETDFITVVAWQKTAEIVAQYFDKGQMIIISGRLQMREWTDQEGNRHKTAEVIADSVYFGEPKHSNNGDVGALQDRISAAGFTEIENDDDLPF